MSYVLLEENINYDYKIYTFDSVKEYTAFVKYVKKQVRQSPEYKTWITLLHKLPYTDVCMLCGLDTDIEIHHEPIRLQTYVETAIALFLSTNSGFTSFDIAKQVIDWHFNNFVGWITLTKPIHEKVHNRDIFIPSFLIRGNWIAFVQQYWTYMPDEALTNLFAYYQKHIEYNLPCTFVLNFDSRAKKLHIEPNKAVIEKLNNLDYLAKLYELAQERLNFDALIRDAIENMK